MDDVITGMLSNKIIKLLVVNPKSNTKSCLTAGFKSGIAADDIGSTLESKLEELTLNMDKISNGVNFKYIVQYFLIV